MHGLPSVPGERGQERMGLLLCWDAGSDEPLVGVRGLPPLRAPPPPFYWRTLPFLPAHGRAQEGSAHSVQVL